MLFETVLHCLALSLLVFYERLDLLELSWFFIELLADYLDESTHDTVWSSTPKGV